MNDTPLPAVWIIGFIVSAMLLLVGMILYAVVSVVIQEPRALVFFIGIVFVPLFVGQTVIWWQDL